MTEPGRGASPLMSVEKGKRDDWQWFCEVHDCGWYGIGCPSEAFAQREADRHVAEAHS